MQHLYETSRRISAAMDTTEVIAAYLDQVATRGQYACSIVLYERSASGERTAVRLLGRWTPEGGRSLTEMRLPYTNDALDPLLDAGQTVMISDVHTDPRVSEALRGIQRTSGRPALALVPLIARGERIGSVVLSYPVVYVWRESDLRLYQATAALLATTLDSRRQQLLLTERGQQVAVLEERQRLARELHDSVTQLLFSMTLIAQSVGTAWQRDPEEGKRRIERVLDLSQAALAEMRSLLTELRPADGAPMTLLPETVSAARIRREGLVNALRQHCAELETDGLQIDLDVETYAPLPHQEETILFRIAQETLNNVVKHARAHRVALRMTAEGGSVCLTIADDGIGFALDTKRKPNTFGLTILRERAEALGGTLRIVSTPGSGTAVAVTIPRKEGAP